jgi:hypothetical protein
MREIPELGEAARGENDEHGEAERELVDPQPEEVDPRAQWMPFQPQHDLEGIGVFVRPP